MGLKRGKYVLPTGETTSCGIRALVYIYIYIYIILSLVYLSAAEPKKKIYVSATLSRSNGGG